ncbi:MAG: class I SAM-dependent methyltransferase [Myxococcales bacterium]|nr:class I SAM-dependent methyltransferase [Myxococcales bacterium]
MSSYVYMKILESTPERYDRGIRLLSRRRIESVYQAIADLAAAPGRRLLDIGSGTGGVALACAARGAIVTGIDRNAGMLEVARAKTLPPGSSGSLEWIELGAAEIEDRFEPATFDAVTASLVFSELSPDEQAYVLGVVKSLLKPGGLLVVADEVLPPSTGRRLWHKLTRFPVAILTWLLTQTTTHPIADLQSPIRQAGFVGLTAQNLPPGDFVIVTANTPAAPSNATPNEPEKRPPSPAESGLEVPK